MKEKARVLIVDDIPTNIQVLMNTLKNDYAILASTNGKNAIKQALSFPQPDIILLDIMMPDMDGYEVCKILKSNDLTKDIPIMFVTALAESTNEEMGLELGAVDYITKPINPHLLKSRIRNHLELKLHKDHLQKLVDKKTYQLQLSQEATIEAMGIVAEHRDPETGGHIQRTKDYVKVITTQLATNDKYKDILTIEYIDTISNSAPLHDIGKVAISDSILLKNGILTDDEFTIMKTHALIGEQTIIQTQERFGESQFLDMAKKIAGTHHEQWDGNGYPKGLKGEEIPLCGRIMAIADVFDALLSKRVYKEPFTLEESLEIIKNKRDNHFDPEVVDAFFEVIEEIDQISKQYI